MARRTLDEIQNSILDKKNDTSSLGALEVLTTNEKQTLLNLDSTSKVAIWRLWVFIQAFAIWVHEGFFETHIKEIEELIALNKIHTPIWYKKKALEFQFGMDLVDEADYYDNNGIDESLVLDSKIIKQASVSEVAGRLKIKVAKEVSGVLVELSPVELASFMAYIQLIKDAGTRIEIISRPPDVFKFSLDLYFNPLILGANGARLDGNSPTPVIDATKEFLYQLEFNGEFILTKLTDYIQKVDGVEMPVFSDLFGKYALNPYVSINETYIADSGYMVLDENSITINYIARELL